MSGNPPAKPPRLFSRYVDFSPRKEDFNLADMVARARPNGLRDFDQIFMMSGDLLMQTILIAPRLEGETVVFLGDGDCMSLMIGLFAQKGRVPRPSRMIVLDFDKRLLKTIHEFAAQQAFGHLIETHAYNICQPVPEDLRHVGDWFYANPPYGSKNEGLSAAIWIGRCMELTRPLGSHGCIILPYDESRGWSQKAMHTVQQFLTQNGFVIGEMLQQVHTYHLPDDYSLASSVVVVDRVWERTPPWDRRPIGKKEAPRFYGEKVKKYPLYIEEDGTWGSEWPAE